MLSAPLPECWEIHSPQLPQRCQAPWPLGQQMVHGSLGPSKGTRPIQTPEIWTCGPAQIRGSWMRDSRDFVDGEKSCCRGLAGAQKQQVMLQNMAMVQAWNHHFADKPLLIMALGIGGNGGNGNINKEGIFKQPCSMIHSHLRAGFRWWT